MTNLHRITAGNREAAKLIDENFQTVLLDYTEDEVDTGTKWVEGSEIYQKTIATGNLLNNGEKRVPHNIKNLYRVVRIEGKVFSGYATFTLPHYNPQNLAAGIGINVDEDTINIVTGMDRTSFYGNVTLWYIKNPEQVK